MAVNSLNNRHSHKKCSFFIKQYVFLIFFLKMLPSDRMINLQVFNKAVEKTDEISSETFHKLTLPRHCQ